MKLSYFFGVIAFSASAFLVLGQTPINTTPQGMIAIPLARGKTTYFSLPLEANPAYTGAVSSATTNSITIGDSPAPWTTSPSEFATVGSPYFVKFTSGAQQGRIVKVTGNNTNSVTVDTTDGIGSSEPLTGNTDSVTSSAPTTFNVAAGDTFEVFPGETLGTVFGDNTTNSDGTTNSLLLTKATSVTHADSVGLLSTTTAAELTYFFNSQYGYWQQYQGPTTNGVPVNANGIPVPPYSSLAVSVLNTSTNTVASLPLLGQVTLTPLLAKTASKTSRYLSTQVASDVTLGQLALGANFYTNNSAAKADTVGVYNSSVNPPRFDIFYQDGTLTWRKYGDTSTAYNYNTNIITVGSCVIITQTTTVHGANSFLLSSLPYTNN